MTAFRVALSADFRKPDGSPSFPEFDLSPLDDHSDIDLFYLEPEPEISAAQLADVDALILLTPRVGAGSLTRNGRLAVVARFGVGYDNVDLAACSDHDVAVVITPAGVRRPVAVSILTNALDGPAWAWSDSLIHILQGFEKRGAPGAKTRDWTGRWYSLWRTIDFIPMRDHVLVDDPGLAVPFSDASEVAVQDRDTGTIRLAPGIANFGEDAHLVRGKSGRIREVWLGGTKYLPERRLASELERRYGG